MNPANVCLFKVKNKNKVWNMFTVTDKDTRMTHQWHRFSISILNLEQFSHLIFVLQLLTLNRQFLAGTNDITNKASKKKKTFGSFNFAITRICVEVRLAEGGTRTGDINRPQVKL